MSISFVRTLILYSCVIIALRLMGKRQIGELQPSELVVTILVSELAAVPMQDFGIPILAGIIPMITLVSLEVLISYLCMKSTVIRRLFNGNPCIIIKNGKLDSKKLRDMRLTVDEVMEELRLANIDSIRDVKYAVIETNGQLSYVLAPPAQPVTAEMMSLTPLERGVPLVLVSDGKLIQRNMKILGKDRNWIEKQIQKHNIDSIQDVFIFTLDDVGNFFMQAKENCRKGQ